MLNKKKLNIYLKIGRRFNFYARSNSEIMYKMHKENEGNSKKWYLHTLQMRDTIVGKGGVKMRDFPIFTTEYGVSSLVLKEIPYKKQAFIRIRDVQPGFFKEHLQECVSFCRMAGAEAIFASGNEELNAYPLYTRVLEMRAAAWVDPEKLACLFPVTESTAGKWRGIYNDAMRAVDNSGTLESRDEKQLAESIGAYFVHKDGELLGIGWLDDCKLLAVAAVRKGAGETVMHTLMSLVEGDTMTLEVASTNDRAIRLYEKLGFLTTGEISCWYRVG